MTTEVVPLSLALTVLEVALWCVWAAHTVPKLLEHPELPPSLPLPPPLHQSSPSPPLSSVSPSAHPQPTICAVGLPRVCQSPSTSWLEYPLSPPPTYESRTPPRPFDPAAPPWLLAPSSPPWPVSPPAPPGSLVPPAPPWSVVDHLPLRDSIPPAAPRPSGSVRLLLSFGSTVAFQIPASASVAGAICSALALQILLVALAHRFSISASGSTSTCSAAVGQYPGVISPSSTMAPPSIVSTLDSVRPPPEHPPIRPACLPAIPLPSPVTIPTPLLVSSSEVPLRPFLPVYDVSSGRGANCHSYGLFVVFSPSCAHIWLCS